MQQPQALLQREQRRLGQIDRNGNDDAVSKLQTSFYYVFVPASNGIEGARIYGDSIHVSLDLTLVCCK